MQTYTPRIKLIVMTIIEVGKKRKEKKVKKLM